MATVATVSKQQLLRLQLFVAIFMLRKYDLVKIIFGNYNESPLYCKHAILFTSELCKLITSQLEMFETVANGRNCNHLSFDIT